jgi:hypothetical protein
VISLVGLGVEVTVLDGESRHTCAASNRCEGHGQIKHTESCGTVRMTQQGATKVLGAWNCLPRGLVLLQLPERRICPPSGSYSSQQDRRFMDCIACSNGAEIERHGMVRNVFSSLKLIREPRGDGQTWYCELHANEPSVHEMIGILKREKG